MKRLLVVAFAVPPTPGANPGRARHLARHLPEFGWEAIILTPRHPRRRLTVERTREHREYSIPLRLVSNTAGRPFWLQETEYRDLLSSWRPVRRTDDGLSLPGLYGREVMTPGEIALEDPPAPRHLLQRLIAAVRCNPDARAGWIPPAIDGALAACEILKPDAVLSLSPPVSSHVIASRIGARIQVPWLADLREAWGGTGVGPIKAGNRARLLRGAGIVSLEPSFDPADLPGRTGEPASAPILVHAGPTSIRGRNPLPLLDAVRRIMDAGPPSASELRVRFLGARDPHLPRAIGERFLSRIATIEPTVPWEVSLQTQSQAGALLVLLGDQDVERAPDRLLEAMSAGRPVFAIGPSGTRTEQILRETHLGSYHTDAASLADGFERWLRDGAPGGVMLDQDGAGKYHAKNVIASLVRELDRATGQS